MVLTQSPSRIRSESIRFFKSSVRAGKRAIGRTFLGFGGISLMDIRNWEHILGLAILLVSLLVGERCAAAPSISTLSPTGGVVGATVTINGANFGTSPGSVTFNGTTAAITTWNSASIVVTVPSGATTGNVVVNAGGVASNGVNFTVTYLPSGWSDSDLGSVGVAGYAGYS